MCIRDRKGGAHSLPLLYLAVDLWDRCYVRHIYPVAVHVVSQRNGLVDFLSRLQSCSQEWSLDNRVFRGLCRHWGSPLVNVFASVDNNKCNCYCSWTGIGHHSWGDAFTTGWTTGLLYMFPPIPLIQKTIVKICQDNADTILITPWWSRQPWLSALCNRAQNISAFHCFLTC